MVGILRGALCAVVLGAVGVGAAQASIMVDDFTQSIGPVWPQVQSASTVSGPSETEAVASVLGGVRGYAVKSATITVPGLDQLSSNVFHNGTVSLFDYQSSVGTNGTVELFYGDKSSNPLGLTGVTGVTVNFLAADGADALPLVVNVTMTNRVSPGVWTASGASALNNVTGPNSVTVTGFSPALVTVDAIEVDFVAPAGADFRVDSITLTTVPEPASLGVMGVGALMLLRRRR